MTLSHQVPDVLFCLTGDIRANSRAVRQIDAMTGAGLSVEAVGLAEIDAVDVDVQPNRRLIHYVRPAGSGPPWFWKIHRLFRAHARAASARHLHASDLFVLPALAQRAAALGASLSFDSRELYPHVGATANKPWASLFWTAIERAHIRRADVVFTVNNSIADLLAKNYRIDRPVVVPNIPLPETPAEDGYLRRLTGAEEDEIILLLQGHLKPGRGCELILEAMPRIHGAHLVFLGEGPLRLRLEARAIELGLQSGVHFHDLVPPELLLNITASADLGICLIEPLTESLRLSLPNKLFEYLKAGVPVVASDLPEIARVIRGFDVGVCVPELTPGAVSNAITSAINDFDLMRKWRGNTAAVFETFDPHAASEAFLSKILQLLEA